MPNWCENVAVFSHDDPEQIKKLVTAFHGSGLMQEFYPCPQDLRDTIAGALNPEDPKYAEHTRKVAENQATYGHDNWYSWCVDHWGTKWDVRAEYPARVAVAKDGHSARLTFDSAWSPPLGFYEYMEHEHGFKIDAYYFEGGVGFCGRWHDGNDTFFDVPATAAEVIESIPAALDELFAISKRMIEYETDAEDTDPEAEPTE